MKKETKADGDKGASGTYLDLSAKVLQQKKGASKCLRTLRCF